MSEDIFNVENDALPENVAELYNEVEETLRDESMVTFEDLGLAPEVLEAVKMAGYETPSPIQAKAIPALLQGANLLGTIFHSDRGSQYTSEAFKEALKDSKMIQSLSGTGHCFDNARTESFFATLKKEKIYRIAAYKLTREEVKTIIFRYVFIYYNRMRVYTSNPFGLSPVKYREWATAHKNSTAA